MDQPYSLYDYSAYGALSTVGAGSSLNDFLAGAGLASGNGNGGNKVVVYIPVTISVPLTLYGAMWLNGGTVSGNIDIGIMNQYGTRLANIGSTAQTPINVAQTANFSGGNLSVTPGIYFIAFTQDNTSGTINRYGLTNAVIARALGCQTETTGSFGIPTTWGVTGVGSTFVPCIGISIQSVF